MFGGSGGSSGGGGPEFAHKSCDNYRIIGPAVEPITIFNPAGLLEESKLHDKYIEENFPEVAKHISELRKINAQYRKATSK
jgi:hypothetical protein